MPGDGIGNQVLPEAIRVLDAVGFEADYVHADIGWECWINEGNALPERTIDLLRKHKVGLFGAITSKPKKQAEAELRPELKGKGYQYFSPIVTMRQKFNLDICMRPCLSFPGNPLNFIRKKPAGGFEEPTVDVVVFRQNTEGLYAGVEWSNPPQKVREALRTHAKFKPFEHVPGEDLAISVRIITRAGGAPHLRSCFPARAAVWLQVGHYLREAECAARNLGPDGRSREGCAEAVQRDSVVVHQHRRADHVADEES